MARHKLRFLACWANESDEDMFAALALEVQGRFEELSGGEAEGTDAGFPPSLDITGAAAASRTQGGLVQEI